MPARLIYLMGPSGSGKDSLIDAARDALCRLGIDVSRRVITRSAEAVGERAVGVSPEAFERRRRDAEFAMNWQANGLQYGIERDINDRLATGQSVLVNGSRAYLPQALALYPNMLPILLTVDSQVLRRRLEARGRESAAEIEHRLLRNERLQTDPAIWEKGAVPIEHLDNSSDLDDAVQRLLALLRRYGISEAVDQT